VKKEDLTPPYTTSNAVAAVAGLLTALVTLWSAAGEPPASGDLALILEDAAPYSDKSGKPCLQRIELNLTVREGKWDSEVWGTTMFFEPRWAVRTAYGKSEAEGRIMSLDEAGGRTRLKVETRVPRDIWGTPELEADYTLELERQGNEFKGRYSGQCNGRPVQGQAHGLLNPPFSPPVQAFHPLAACEHPRLVFRRGDLARLRRHAETPEGTAILTRLRELLARPIRNESAGYHAAGHGLLCLLHDDPAEARKARAIVERVVFGPGYGGQNPWHRGQEKERHLRAPLGVGVALAFDLCYDAWPEDFRTKVAAQLEWKARDLVEGFGREEYNDNYASNHVAICQGGGGVVAMALLGEPGEYFPKPLSPTEQAETPIEAPAGFQPGKDVPVVKLEFGRMPRKWLFAGPLKPEDKDREFLAHLGGREKARPEAGTKVSAGDRTVAFEPLDEAKGIWNSRHTNNLDALDLVMPFNRDYHSTVFYYTVVENDQPRLLEFLCEHGGTRAFLAGRPLVKNGFVRLGKGRFPLLLQVGVGATEPWGRIWTTPRFVEAVEDHAKRAAERHARELAAWERGRQAWLARGKDMPAIPRLLRMAEQRMRRHVTYSTGDHGWYNEGEGYSRYAHTVGTLPFEVAWRTTMGEEFGGSMPGRGWYVPLWATRLLNWGGKPVHPWYGPGGQWSNDFYRSGDFVLGFALVPTDMKPACRWVFDRLWGLQGDKTFGIHEPHQAAYALAHYPFGVEAKHPETILPKALLDRDKGFVQFRSQWKDGDDFVACIYGKSEPTGGGWSYADGASFRLFGLGTMWAVKGGTGKDGGQSVENVVVVPSTNGWLGGHVTHWEPRPHGGTVSFDTSDIYLARPDGKGGAAGEVLSEAPPDAKLVMGRYLDWGIRGLRSFAADYSGQSGAEAVVAIADRIALEPGGKLPAGEPVWQMHTGGTLSVKGNTFTVVGKDRATLRGTFLAPAGAKLAAEGGRLTATGGREFLVVMTIQRGEAPKIETTGVGLNIRARVGRQQVSFDGKGIRIGD